MSSSRFPEDPATGNSAAPHTFVNQRRSTRVWHETILVARIPMLDGQTIETKGQTFAVNVHGGLLQLSVEVHIKQALELMNPDTQMVEKCSVVRTEHAEGGQWKVGFAFDRPAPHFWAIAHPPEDWGIWRENQVPSSDPQASSAAGDAAPGNTASRSACVNRRRSTRVWHETSLVVRIPNPEGQRVEEWGQTFAVNVHGGLLRLPIDVKPGQILELVNPATQMAVRSRVVRTQRAKEGYLKVAFEFERPVPTFWAIVHPPEDWDLKRS